MNKIEQANDVIDAPDFAQHARSGRATFDERGNSIWEWQTEPGVFSRDINSRQLAALEANELRLVDADNSSIGLESTWTFNTTATGTFSARQMRSNEAVLTERRKSVNKESAFDRFLKHMGLPV